MTRNTDQLFKTIQTNGKLLTHNDNQTGVTQTHCSTFIKEKGLLVRGECDNPKSSERNAMVLVCDPETGQVKGGEMFECV